MGQRHQIFVKIANPVKFAYFNTLQLKKKAIEQFGNGEFTILVYHNQWLFGRGALQNALSLLQFGKQFTKGDKTDIKTWGAYDCPFGVNGMKQKFNLDEITNSIAFIMNYRPVNKSWLSAGIGSSFYLKGEPEMRLDFTMGDNNDGITIVDLVENKYCFMNINSPRSKEDGLGFGSCDLPTMKPVNARAYVSAYYGETIEATNPHSFGDHDRTKVIMPVGKQQKIVDGAIKINKVASKPFDKFEVLSLAELQVMFETMYLTKKKPKVKVLPKVAVRKPRGAKITL